MEICCIQQFLQKVRQDYQDGHQFISGPKDVVVMNNDKIVLQLQKGEFAPIGNTVKDGWKITPLNKMKVGKKFFLSHLFIAFYNYIWMQVSKKKLMTSSPTELLSPCCLQLSWTKESEPSPINLRIYLQGSMQDNFLTLSLPQFLVPRPRYAGQKLMGNFVLLYEVHYEYELIGRHAWSIIQYRVCHI